MIVSIVYILYSPNLDKFYIGQTNDLSRRLEEHNSDENLNWTKVGKPWELFLQLKCSSKAHALRLESKNKRQKSKQYLRNLKQYAEMREKLIEVTKVRSKD